MLPTPVSGLENSMGCVVHGIAVPDTTERLSFHLLLCARTSVPHHIIPHHTANNVWLVCPHFHFMHESGR